MRDRDPLEPPTAPPDPDGEIRVRRGPLTVVVVDPHAPIREGLPLLLAREGIEIVGAAATGDGAEAVIAQHDPDVVLVALDLVDADGIVLLRRLAQRGARSAALLYTDAEDAQQAAVAVHAGAAGVVSKRRPIGDLAEALRAVAAGRMWFHQAADAPVPAPRLAPVLHDLRRRRTAALSSAELRVLSLVAHGSSTEEAAELLSLSPHTVRTHLRNVMRKLEASSRAHAVAIAIRESAIRL